MLLSEAPEKLGLRCAEVQKSSAPQVRVVASRGATESPSGVGLPHVDSQSRLLAPLSFRLTQRMWRRTGCQLYIKVVVLVKLVVGLSEYLECRVLAPCKSSLKRPESQQVIEAPQDQCCPRSLI